MDMKARIKRVRGLTKKAQKAPGWQAMAAAGVASYSYIRQFANDGRFDNMSALALERFENYFAQESTPFKKQA